MKSHSIEFIPVKHPNESNPRILPELSSQIQNFLLWNSLEQNMHSWYLRSLPSVFSKSYFPPIRQKTFLSSKKLTKHTRSFSFHNVHFVTPFLKFLRMPYVNITFTSFYYSFSLLSLSVPTSVISFQSYNFLQNYYCCIYTTYRVISYLKPDSRSTEILSW